MHGALDGVLNGTRWKATDDLKSSHLTLYDVASDIASHIDEDSEQKMLQKLSNGEGHARLCADALVEFTHIRYARATPGKAPPCRLGRCSEGNGGRVRRLVRGGAYADARGGSRMALRAAVLHRG